MNSLEPTLLALDIGARNHAFAWECHGHSDTGTLANTSSEIRAFFKQLMRHTGALRVLMEATGIYYLDVALIACELGAQVSVVNPRASHNFAKAMQQRNKTDRLDALMLLDFLKRMPFAAWQAPRKALLELRHVGRYLVQLTEEKTAASNRLHALSSTDSSPVFLRKDLSRRIGAMERNIDGIRARAVAMIQTDERLQASFEALTTIVGVAENSAVSLLSELAVLPPTMSSRACVSHAGLDPRVFESGTSVHKAPRISRHGNKYLRRALFHPALTASVHDPLANAFKQRLLDRGKKKMQANVAIMRKMLTAAWVIVQHPQTYDATKLYCTAKTT